MIELPKKYNTENPKYQHHNGKNKISHSQYTSYKDEKYRPDYYVQYFSGIDLGGNIFSEFGGFCGETIQHIGEKKELPKTSLSENCIEILKSLEYPDNCVYEEEIVVDLGDNLTVQGFIDRIHYQEDGVEITDFKTLNLDSDKKDYYASEEYGQTTLYAYQKEQEGFNILNSQVIGLGRKGNSWDGKYPMKLSGRIEVIPTPYSKERAEKVLNDIKETAKKISEDYRIFKKYFSN